MKLTEKDIAFLRTLKRLMDHADLRVIRRGERLILRQNSGDNIESNFRMTRQGVRWRFQRTMDMYISAFQTILLIEQTLGSEVRELAIAASRARHKLAEPTDAKIASKDGFKAAPGETSGGGGAAGE
ncbi:MAG: hypothetical protein AAGA25_01390 [Planctomycetota bacterium]